MYRRKKEHRHRRTSERRTRPVLMRPAVQIGILLVVALIIYLILQSGGGSRSNVALPATITVEEAYTKYQNGAFVLDVRTQEEWNEFHAPNTTLIPLDQLASRLNEVPQDKEIVVVCRSGNRSQQGRDILLNAGYKQVTSMTGGLNEWRSKGYPIQP